MRMHLYKKKTPSNTQAEGQGQQGQHSQRTVGTAKRGKASRVSKKRKKIHPEQWPRDSTDSEEATFPKKPRIPPQNVPAAGQEQAPNQKRHSSILKHSSGRARTTESAQPTNSEDSQTRQGQQGLTHMQVSVCTFASAGGSRTGLPRFRKNIISFPQHVSDLQQHMSFVTSIAVNDIVNMLLPKTATARGSQPIVRARVVEILPDAIQDQVAGSE